ncbi:type VI secretion system membrane subunit TssM [Labrys sp. KNU-23]|uniref:type VI secretion system membrane subunit TssM n=1 Tax=Labrys sp. KNU-23 TaxID=2789216 RepID=UPI0011EE0BD0|nr:type VI secretion system membrane subunit TssM [Labrys sp. KNU-23]QEN85233.1 type VI secretion system membrane subunit TssM [Labrys sp. KNU-23]
MKRWIIFIVSFLAVIALCAVIWLVLPLVAVAGIEPFDNPWLRLALIGLLLAVYFCWLAYRIYKHGQSARALAENIAVQEPEDDGSDAVVLADKMRDALLTLKGSRRTKGDFLYELPWYLIVGPPGAGKTTALMNCGLKFPLAAHTGPIAGSGGTRYCDWWFTEDAVFIDTAGRYTTQDSDTEADRKSWLSFLDLLKRHRERQPINGVLVAISIGDLLSMKEAELGAHAVAIRKRLAELNNRLQVDFPVYVIFTKADLVAGFMEYFGNLDPEERKAVWGATFQTKNKKENRVGDVGPEIDLLVSRLSAELPDRLQEEPDPISRVRLTGLPSQLAALKPVITRFLNQIFEPTRYQTSAALRGFYLTSGTQEGTPIDQLLGSLSRDLGLQAGASLAYSGRAKSFFLEHLLTKVVFGEAGWVSTNAAAVRRKILLQTSGYVLVAGVTLAALGGWLTSYYGNKALIDRTDVAAAAYASDTAALLKEDPVNDADFLKIVGPLGKLRDFPWGYDKLETEPQINETLGLGQHKRVGTASVAAYRDGLDRLLRPRILFHLEKRLADLQDQPEQLYEPLKVYMMLGGDPTIPVDTALIEGWMRGDWENLYPGEPNKATRDSLGQHLDAMLNIDGTPRPIALNGDLVKASQVALTRLSLAERAFAIIKSTAHDQSVRDWTVAGNAGPDAAVVFGTNDGSPIESVGVQSLFTYDGFYALFLDKMKSVITLLQNERWVLGEAGSTQAIDEQYANLGPDLYRIYDQEFIKAWTAALGKLKLNSFAADKPGYATLRAATGAASPIKLLFESISAQTRLTEARQGADSDVGGKLKDAAVKAATKAVTRAAGSKLDDMAAIGLDAAKKASGRGGNVEAPFVPGAIIQEHFRRYHDLVRKNGDKSQIDLLVEQLKGLYQSLIDEQDFERAAQARQNMQTFLGSIATSSSRLETPFDTMFRDAMAEFEQKIIGDKVADLKGDLKGSVTRECLNIVGNKYPFSPGSKQEVPIGEFGRLFGPNGVFDTFFREKLAGLVDTSGAAWGWKQNSKFSQALSSETLHQFQNAARIKEAFFSGRGTSPNVKFALVTQSMSQKTASVSFEVNGTKLDSPFGVVSRGDFEWPGRSPDGTASITMPESDGTSPSLRFTGGWALYRLLQKGDMRQSGNKATARFVVGGREVTYQLTFDTLDNPFTILSQLKFACPSDL